MEKAITMTEYLEFEVCPECGNLEKYHLIINHYCEFTKQRVSTYTLVKIDKEVLKEMLIEN